MIISISGRRGAGKNTLADLIEKLQPEKNWRVNAFADPLKKIAAYMTGLQLRELYTQEGKTKYLPEWGMTVGEILQKLGTNAVRDNLHQDAWVLTALSGIKDYENIIFCDMRFPNEAEAIKAKGGILIRIEGDPQKQQGDGTRDDSHPSETALDNYDGFDFIIQNTGSLDALKGAVQLMLHQINSRATV